jgi:hypothetical protein
VQNTYVCSVHRPLRNRPEVCLIFAFELASHLGLQGSSRLEFHDPWENHPPREICDVQQSDTCLLVIAGYCREGHPISLGGPDVRAHPVPRANFLSMPNLLRRWRLPIVSDVTCLVSYHGFLFACSPLYLLVSYQEAWNEALLQFSGRTRISLEIVEVQCFKASALLWISRIS